MNSIRFSIREEIQTMDLKQKRLSSDYKYKGKILNLRVDQAEMPDGQTVEREVVEHHGGVGIAMEDNEGKFFLVTQYRYAQEKVMIEFPAGKMEMHEDPLVTAKREIAEETGYAGKDFMYLGQMVPTGAYDTEVIHMYYARMGEYTGQKLDSDEFLNVSRMTLREIMDASIDMTIDDGKTLAMIFLISQMKERGLLK